MSVSDSAAVRLKLQDDLQPQHRAHYTIPPVIPATVLLEQENRRVWAATEKELCSRAVRAGIASMTPGS